jgi:hypothetical protein
MIKKIAGNLRDLDLVELLVLLCSKKDQTGKIVFTDKDESGEIYIESGKILHVTYLQSLEGINALYTFLTWEEGDFEFINDAKPSKITIDIDTKPLLVDCLNKKKELNVIKELILSRDEVFKLSGRTNAPVVNMSTDEIFIISFIDGNRSLRDIEKLSGRNRFELFKILYRFLNFDIVSKVEQKPLQKEEVVSKELFENIEKRLKLLVGPVTEVMLEKCIKKIGYEKNSIPVSKLTGLVDLFVAETGIKKDDVKDIVKDIEKLTSGSLLNMTFPTTVLSGEKTEEKKGGFFSFFKFKK